MKSAAPALKNAYHSISALLLVSSAVFLIALQIKSPGWILLFGGALFTYFLCEKQFKKDLLLVYLSISLLGIAPITTSLAPNHAIQLAIPLFLAVALPYFISRFVFKDRHVRFTFSHGRNWYKTEILYVAGVAAFAYLVAPIVARLSQVYVNWIVEPTLTYTIMFFLAMIFIGIWDEFFFMATVLNLLKRHFSFHTANLLQSIIFSSFLYHIGFRSWTIILLFIFTLLQGRIFLRTESLFYLISIHVAADTVLTFVIINAHYPHLFNFFLIK